ncbi:transposable element Tcb1 transposase [Trichonephila clavipes]|nr:transposable element Tcb1 transposase [Trichonephila clavipes]
MGYSVVTRRLVSTRTIRRRLQQSGKSTKGPLLRSPLTESHRRTWKAEWNDFSFTNESRFCLQHHDGDIQVERHCGERPFNYCVMHHHTGPAPGIMIWGGIGFHCHAPLVRNAGTLNSQHYISEVLQTVVLHKFSACH